MENILHVCFCTGNNHGKANTKHSIKVIGNDNDPVITSQTKS